MKDSPIPFERLKITTHEAWLEMRRQDVTASVVGCLLGFHEYVTPYGLWARMSGLIEDDKEENDFMRRGRLLEPVAINMLREERQQWIIEYPLEAYYRDPTARIGATPDAFAKDPSRKGFGVIQVKTVDASVFRKRWLYADNDPSVPDWILYQVMLEAHLTGASWAVIAILVNGYKLEDLRIVNVTLYPTVITRMRNLVEKFFLQVASGQPPEIDYARDKDPLSLVIGDDDGSSIDLSGWNEGPALALEDQFLSIEAIRIASRRKAIKAEVLHKVGTASSATFNGREFITARTIRRNTYTTKDSSYRDVRFKNQDGDVIEKSSLRFKNQEGY